LYRTLAGKNTAKEQPVKADIVIPVPESGRIYDDAFAAQSGIPATEGLIRNRYYSARTFMKGREHNRRREQRKKFHALPDIMRGKKICQIEDSIVRASVCPETVAMCREDGAATEVHVRVCSPPVCHRCHLGIDMSKIKELVAANNTIEEIRDNIIHSDSLGYLSVEGMLDAVGIPRENLCLGCFTGEYPVPPPAEK